MKNCFSREAAYGAEMATYLRLSKALSLVIQPVAKSPIAITRLVSETGLAERSQSIPVERAFVVSMHLTPASAEGCEIWVDDHHSGITSWPAGGGGIYDLEANPRVRNRGPVDWVHYHIPRETFDAFTDDNEVSRIESLEVLHGTVDPVLHQLTQLILPSLTRPQSFSTRFLVDFRLLFCAHVPQNYSTSINRVTRPLRALPPAHTWRRVGRLRQPLHRP